MSHNKKHKKKGSVLFVLQGNLIPTPVVSTELRHSARFPEGKLQSKRKQRRKGKR